MTLRIKSLQLSNFRCFKEATLNLHPRLTVIVADNGMGKTALLDAIATAMAEYVDFLLDARYSTGILPSDVRSSGDDECPAMLILAAECDGKQVEWSLSRKSATSRRRRGTKQLAGAREAAAMLRQHADSEEFSLPLFTYYQSTRFAQSTFFDQKYAGMRNPPDGRFDGFTDYMTPLSSASHFNEWYADRWKAMRDTKVLVHGGDHLKGMIGELTSVRDAVSTVLKPTGWSIIDWDKDADCVVVEHVDGRRLPLSWLSSGIRSMVALTADLAHRCVSLNPHLGDEAASRTPGTVLIDEVDLHLHPSWQQRVVELLQSAFGALQLVLTTHSPQVLSTVHAESVRIVKHHADESYINTPEYQTRGVESTDVLSQIMGVDPIPQVEEARDLQIFRAMIEDGVAGSDAGLQLRERLLKHFGEVHPLMLDCGRLERFVAFKRRQKQGGAD
tara:strand:- start:241769 stop:243103 length:1335 start_codon:yes stop_codon:yes gene_type:complete